VLKTTTPTPQKEWKQSHEDRESSTGFTSASVRLLLDLMPSYWWNSERFLGPAALLQATRWVKIPATRRPARGSTISRTRSALPLPHHQ